MVTYEELVEKVARIIDPASFGTTPEMYGFRGPDKQDRFKRTFGYGGQLVAIERAEKIIATILEALSEPSEAMVAAAQSEWPDTARMLKAALAASPLVEEERR
ncbi:hypothetical protein BFS86_19755 [Shewanella algae]|nr:hypothetical protein BFS86_19755 [Shewanella algae]